MGGGASKTVRAQAEPGHEEEEPGHEERTALTRSQALPGNALHSRLCLARLVQMHDVYESLQQAEPAIHWVPSRSLETSAGDPQKIAFSPSILEIRREWSTILRKSSPIIL